jgi:hypothetical protein
VLVLSVSDARGLHVMGKWEDSKRCLEFQFGIPLTTISKALAILKYGYKTYNYYIHREIR